MTYRRFKTSKKAAQVETRLLALCPDLLIMVANGVTGPKARRKKHGPAKILLFQNAAQSRREDL